MTIERANLAIYSRVQSYVATGSEVGWDCVEAATNTFGELAPHLV